jgi:hypothetical protein
MYWLGVDEAVEVVLVLVIAVVVAVRNENERTHPKHEQNRIPAAVVNAKTDIEDENKERCELRAKNPANTQHRILV